MEHLTTLSLELHIETRRDLCPDPEFDPILGIFYHLHRDIPDGISLCAEIIGMILVDPELKSASSTQEDDLITADLPFTSTQESTTADNTQKPCKPSIHRKSFAGCGITNMVTEYVPDEISLLRALVRLIRRSVCTCYSFTVSASKYFFA